MQPHFTVFLLYILVAVQNPEKLPLCLLMILAFSTKDSVSSQDYRSSSLMELKAFLSFDGLFVSCLISFNQAGKLLYCVVLKPTGA